MFRFQTRTQDLEADDQVSHDNQKMMMLMMMALMMIMMIMMIMMMMLMMIYLQEVKVEKVEEFEPGQDSYLEVKKERDFSVLKNAIEMKM